MTPDEIRAITDPAARARAAGDAILELAGLENELSHIRSEAVNELREAGLSHARVAAELGVSRSRAAAIATGPTGPSGAGPTGPTGATGPMSSDTRRRVNIVCLSCGISRPGPLTDPPAPCPKCGSRELGYME